MAENEVICFFTLLVEKKCYIIEVRKVDKDSDYAVEIAAMYWLKSIILVQRFIMVVEWWTLECSHMATFCCMYTYAKVAGQTQKRIRE